MSNLTIRLEFLLQSFFTDQNFCPHCDSKISNIVAKKYFFIKIKQCLSCYLYFTSPIYEPFFSKNFYNNAYSGEGSTTTLPTNEELTKLFDTNFSESDKSFKKRIKLIKSVCNTGLSLLEIGSSWGYFLWQAKEQGFDATGLEVGKVRREFGNKYLGVSIVNSTDHFSKNSIDIVYTSHVLEHFIDLSNIFREINSILVDKGKLVIEVPNFSINNLSIIGAVHPLGFSSKFFDFNLPKYGFKIIGFFDSWEDFPSKTKSECFKSNIILLAEKTIIK